MQRGPGGRDEAEASAAAALAARALSGKPVTIIVGLSSRFRTLTVSMPEDFDAIFRRHVDAVFRFALSSVRRRDIADELVGEAFLALFRNFEGIDQSRLPAWLIAVVRNRARDHWRRQNVEHGYLESLPRDQATAAAGVNLGLFDRSELKPIHRVCLRLRYVEGLTRAEIASATGLSETQVKGHLQYALRLLRAAVVERPV